jgi:hypothetical protein
LHDETIRVYFGYIPRFLPIAENMHSSGQEIAYDEDWITLNLTSLDLVSNTSQNMSCKPFCCHEITSHEDQTNCFLTSPKYELGLT